MLRRRDGDFVETGRTFLVSLFTVKAIEQLKKIVMQLVDDSIRDTYYGKALECLQALRKGCVNAMLISCMQSHLCRRMNRCILTS